MTFSELTEQLTTLSDKIRVIDSTLTRLSIVQSKMKSIKKK